jgi:hypothetical protein
MPLHRDIHWLGRQWAVTGHGLQLIDQKLQGFFDIETGKLWDEGLIAGMYAKEWLNRADFDKGLAVARLRYPQTPHVATPPSESAPAVPAAPVAPLPADAKTEAPEPAPPKFERSAPDETQVVAASPEPVTSARVSIEPPPQPPPDFRMRFEARAKFIRPWRVWMKPLA